MGSFVAARALYVLSGSTVGGRVARVPEAGMCGEEANVCRGAFYSLARPLVRLTMVTISIPASVREPYNKNVFMKYPNVAMVASAR